MPPCLSCLDSTPVGDASCGRVGLRRPRTGGICSTASALPSGVRPPQGPLAGRRRASRIVCAAEPSPNNKYESLSLQAAAVRQRTWCWG